MKNRLALFTAALTLLCVNQRSLAAQAAEDEALFTQFCAACHTTQPAAAGSPNERAPTQMVLKTFTPEAVLNALTNGKMQPQGLALSEAQRRVVSEYATGQRLAAVTSSAPATLVNACKANPAVPPAASTPSWNGYGNGVTGTRAQDARAAGLTAADLPRLKLKWAFGYANVSAARAQPTVYGGRLFVASENGEVHSLDPRTGCAYWTFKALAGVRTSPVVGPWNRGGKSGLGGVSSAMAARMRMRSMLMTASCSGPARCTTMPPPRSPAA